MAKSLCHLFKIIVKLPTLPCVTIGMVVITLLKEQASKSDILKSLRCI